jgi:hypothetical protein
LSVPRARTALSVAPSVDDPLLAPEPPPQATTATIHEMMQLASTARPWDQVILNLLSYN